MSAPTKEKTTLKAEKRDLTGKHVKQLRKTGKIPANVFGPKFTSASISIEAKDFYHAYKIAHETGIVYIELGKESIPTLIKQVQRHPLTDAILHIDFRKIDLTQKIETVVPVQTINDSEAVTVKGGVLLMQANELTIEALPQNIPSQIDVDIAILKELGQEIKVKDLPKSTNYEIKEDPERTVVSVIEHKEESLIAETATEGPEIITEKKEEGEEGAPAEAVAQEKATEKPSEEKKAESSKE